MARSAIPSRWLPHADTVHIADYIPHPLGHFSTTPARTVWILCVRPEVAGVVRARVVDGLKEECRLLLGKFQWHVNYNQHSPAALQTTHTCTVSISPAFFSNYRSRLRTLSMTEAGLQARCPPCCHTMKGTQTTSNIKDTYLTSSILHLQRRKDLPCYVNDTDKKYHQ